MARPVPLTIAVADWPHTMALKTGLLPVEGVAPDFLTVKPQIAAFRRMARELAFDVCEMAPTTYLIARAHGARLVALPIFLMRRFHHSGLLVHPDAGIRHPRDLEGRRVGVRAYSVTTGVWTRGILMEEYGLQSARVIWVVDDEEHVTALRLPDNVMRAPKGVSLADLMAAGELAAGFAGNAGIGRSGSPTGGGWKSEAADYPELFRDAAQREAEWFRRTGIYPMHSALVMKESVLADHPWAARSLFDAFTRAKEAWLQELRSGTAQSAEDKRYRALTALVGEDPLPYGIEANIRSIAALHDIALKQGLIPEPLSLERAFLDPQKL